MNKMVVAALIVAAIAVCVPASAENAKSQEFAVKWVGVFPSKDADWDMGSGLECQLRFWHGEHGGIAFCAGVEQWDAQRETYEEADESGYVAMSVSGDIAAFPVGVSLVHRTELDEDTRFIFELGARYVFIQSDILVNTALSDAYGDDAFSDVVDVDNALLAVVGCAIEGYIAEGISIHAGASYRMDILKPDETFLGNNIGSTSLRGATISLGAVWNF